MASSAPGITRTLRAFWPWIRAERRLIGGSMVALLGGVLLRLAEPWPLKFVFDRVIPTDRPQGMNTPGFIEAMDPIVLLTVAAAAMVSITGVRTMFDYWQRVGFARTAIRVVRQVRNDVFLHLQRLSLSFHDKARTGDLIVRVTRDVSLLRDVASTALMPLVASLLVLVGMLTVMLVLHWKLTLLALVTLPLFWLATARFGKGIQLAARKQRKREGAMASTAAESIAGIREVQALSLEERFAEDFVSRNLSGQKEDLQATRLSARLGRAVDALVALAGALVLWYGAWLVMHGRLTPGDLLVFTAYLKKTLKPAKDFAKYVGRLSKASAAGERVLELLGARSELRDRPGARPARRLDGPVRFEGVSFGYDPERPVLHEIDLEIPAGRFVVLTGPSGAGKSTLVSLLMQLYEPTNGRILVGDRDLRDCTVASVRSQISVVMQDSVLFVASLEDNIRAGDDASPTDAVEAAARLANADGFIRGLAEGYATVVGERGATLSRGQRQRVAIARAAMRRTPLLVLDEPTAGLDEANRLEVVTALRRLADGRTTFLITHDLDLARQADLLVYMEHGQIIECGTPQELLRAQGSFAALAGMRAAGGTAR